MKFNKKKKILKRLRKKGYIKKKDYDRLVQIATERNNNEIIKIKNETINLYKLKSHLINNEELLKKLEFSLK